MSIRLLKCIRIRRNGDMTLSSLSVSAVRMVLCPALRGLIPWGAGCQGLALPGGTRAPRNTCQPWRPRCQRPASNASSFKFLERWPLAQSRRRGFCGADHRDLWLLCGLDSNSDFREGRSELGMLKPVLALADNIPPLSQVPSVPPGSACSEATSGLEKAGPVAPGRGQVLAGHLLNPRCQVWNARLLPPLGGFLVEDGGADG